MKKRIGALFLAFVLLFVAAVPASAARISISKNSVTLEVGETHQLYVTVDSIVSNAQAWASSDTSVAVVDQKGLVTAKGKGSAVITGMMNGVSVECLVSVVEKTVKTTTRYNVLILDASGSVRGKALKREKEAAKRFCRTVLNADGDNYFALVSLSTQAKIICDFTKQYDQLAKAINGMKAKGGTNMNQAFQQADKLLGGVKGGDKVIKNVVLCSDGLPEDGAKAAKGRYKAKNHKFYKYANAVYKTDVKMKAKNYFIYALGFFHNSEGKDLKFGKKLMRDLASKNRYYIVRKPKDIDRVFRKIANKIRKTTKNEPQPVRKEKTSKSSIRLSQSNITIYVGQKVKLKATVKGKNKKIKWKSSNNKVAKVNKKGKVTGVSPGQVKVTAKVGNKKATCIVNVIIKHPTYSQYFMVNVQKSKYGDKKIDEYGIRLITNEEAVIRKCAVYVRKNLDGSYSRTMACTGDNITYAYFVPYLARKGKIIYEGGKTANINTIYLRRGSDGVWSHNGYYGLVNANLEDAYGNELAVESTGVAGKNTQIFDDLNAMKEWLRQ
ncbi:MAG TPA: Ig-like domain-containing protein [Candidatus Anaerobutyricum stercoris]|uniref:Ig-like domain-containing protein n=1 Tax=Candidatus Anaerobutyricum stercoris TaxID=2838457 RepID=A0A9D2ENY7_9FIRM|nr:Ig-like domain-containing protein [Eubacterium sp. An3]OUO27447.1 hypothetical protein B5F87_10360 [Eubacterium sp. An3]HIZ40825.1 Ig-like domain-containing protein [Candidatus Anaerobutyricum stercoris]